MLQRNWVWRSRTSAARSIRLVTLSVIAALIVVATRRPPIPNEDDYYDPGPGRGNPAAAAGAAADGIANRVERMDSAGQGDRGDHPQGAGGEADGTVRKHRVDPAEADRVARVMLTTVAEAADKVSFGDLLLDGRPVPAVNCPNLAGAWIK